MPPASDKDKEIHRLITSGDDLAFARLCDEYYDLVYSQVRNFNKYIHSIFETLIADVVTDAFLKYFKSPLRYNPEKQSLERFLIMDAEGDLKNEWAKLKRRDKNLVDSVELDENLGNSVLEEGTPYQNLVDKETIEILTKKLEEVFENPADIEIAQLMLSGERRTEEFSRILNIEDLGTEQQRREVKRNKDRVEKVLQRKLKESK